MKKFIVIFMFSLLSICFADDIEVSAKQFEGFESQHYSKFSGNVVITKLKDVIKAEELYIYFDKNNQPTRYEAVGNVTFVINTKNSSYQGRAKKMVYMTQKKEFNLIDDAVIEESNSDKKVYGDKISFNEKTGDIKVLSDDKAPVKFIFKVKEQE